MTEPISLDQARWQLKDPLDTDEQISVLIVAAREFVEGVTGLVLTHRSVTETAGQFGRWIDLASWPVTSVDAIRYPLAGVSTLLAPTAWAVSYARRPVRILPVSSGWGVGGAYCGPQASLPIEIDVTAGFATPADVPATVKQAMLLLIASWYGNRDAAEVGARAAAIEIPFGVEVLLRRHRLVRV